MSGAMGPIKRQLLVRARMETLEGSDARCTKSGTCDKRTETTYFAYLLPLAGDLKT